MIALLDDLPLVRLADGTTAPFEHDWLLRALSTAARKAGYPQWWLAEHVAASVTEFLRTQSETTVLPGLNIRSDFSIASPLTVPSTAS